MSLSYRGSGYGFLSRYSKSDHGVKLLDYLNENRRLGFFNDVKICVDNDSFPANRMILSCFSEYFEKMFKVEMKEKYQKSVEVKGIDGTSMETIIEFIYTGSVDLKSDNCCVLLAAADYLQVDDLKTCCFNFLKTHISNKNCFSVLAITNRYQNENLKNHAHRVIEDNFDVASTTNGFNKLSPNDLISWLSSRGESCIEGSCLYNALIRWVKYEKNRALVCHQVFKHFDFDKLSQEFIENTVLKEELLLQSPELCKHFLKEFSICLKIVKQTSTEQRILSLGGTNKQLHLIEIINLCQDFPNRNYYPDLPTNKLCSCSVIFGDCIYNIGGDVLRKETKNVTTKTVWRMNIKESNLQWNRVCSLNEPRSRMGAACFDESLVVAGGENADCCLETAEAYSPTRCAWKKISSLNQARSHFALVTCNNRMYALGGVNDSVTPLSSVECLAAVEDEWELVKEMQIPRIGLAAVICNGFIYAIGGKSSLWSNPTSSVEKYDFIKKRWSYVKEMNFCRYSCAASVMQGRIVVVGGQDSYSKVVTKIESYDPLFDTWSIIGETEDEFYDHSLVLV